MDQRKARTRTLIQLGGLAEKSGLLNTLGLCVGDDLQRELSCYEGVSILMGILSEAQDRLNEGSGNAQKHLWRERGKEVLGG